MKTVPTTGSPLRACQHVKLAVLTTLALVLLPCGMTRADQYQSEVREIDIPKVPQKAVDAQTLLKSTTDPYGRALLLQELAGQAIEQKDYSKAQQLLQQALNLNVLSGPAAELLRKDLASLAMASGNLKQKIPQLEALVKAGQASPEVHMALGAAYLEQRRFKEAVPLLQKGIAATPRPDPNWRMALIAALMGSGREGEAATELESILRTDPNRKEAWMQLAALYLKAGNSERAQATMEVANRLGYLRSVEDRERLVLLTGQIGAPFEAGSVLQAWMQQGLMPPSAENRKLLAALWVRAKEKTLALKVLEELAVSQGSREIYEQMAQLLRERRDYARAEAALSQALQLGKPSGTLMLNLGLVRYQQADVDGALSAFRQAAGFSSQQKLASDWIRYLESGQARELALAAAAQGPAVLDESVSLSGRLLGRTEIASAGVAGNNGPAETSGSMPAVRRRAPGPLTAIGAEVEGNADGSIPAWSGGISPARLPASFRAGQRLVDPFSIERPTQTITARNVDQFRNLLSKGHQALFARYPDYRMPIYKTHRSVSYPVAITKSSEANIGKARLVGSDSLENARLGFPFPKPENGVEALWNHRVRYRGNTVALQSRQAVVTATGKVTQEYRLNETAYFRYGNTDDPVDISSQNILLYYLLKFTGAGLANFLALAHETANSEKDARAIWVAPPGSPKLFRIPPVGYDQPFPGTEAMYFVDMIDMYNGPFDRYVWKLIGKRELMLPYNAYRLSDGSQTYAQQLTPNFFNPDNVRYERHRVWVVEATERGGKRHSFGLRVFYLDEDSWNVVLVENYDHEGRLWRFQEGHVLPHYAVQSANCFPVITYDLKDGRYFASRLLSEEPAPIFNSAMNKNQFLPASVQAKHLR